jgi:hypothetical protein
MILNQILLILVALSLHIGFGVALGLLWKHGWECGNYLRACLSALAFFAFVYFPSCLVIWNLEVLSGGIQIAILLIGLTAAALPFMRWRRVSSLLKVQALRSIYPAVSMLLLASWSLSTVVQDGLTSGAPLALSSTIAGFAAILREQSSD